MRNPMFILWMNKKEIKKEGKDSDCLGVNMKG